MNKHDILPAYILAFIIEKLGIGKTANCSGLAKRYTLTVPYWQNGTQGVPAANIQIFPSRTASTLCCML